MKNFYEQFKENLENRPEPAFEDRLWRKLDKNLNEAERPARGGFAWWWAALGLALLLGSNALFFWELRKANAKISALEIQKDTVFKSTVIYNTDTIYLNRSEGNFKLPSDLNSPKSNIFKAQFFTTELSEFKTAYITNSPDKIINLSNKTPSPFADIIQIKKRKNIEEIALSNARISHLARLRLSPLSQKSPDFTFSEFVLPESKKTLLQHLYGMRPKDFRVGISGDMTIPLLPDTDSEIGFQTGLEATVEFSKNLQLWINASYWEHKYDSEQMNKNLGVPEVIISDDFTFLKAEVAPTGLQYSAGMQYLFNADKNWKPFVGAGFGAVSVFNYDVLYTFRDNVNDIEVGLEEKARLAQLKTNFLFLRAGVEYEISDSWFWNLRLSYRANLDKAGLRLPELVGLGMGLSYRF